MQRFGLEVLNIGFFVFHTVLIVFNVIGWAWKRTRIWNLVTLGLTALSWFVMGAFYGIGYCVCTQFHFEVREALGIHDGADNYLQLLARTLLGIDPAPSTVRQIAGIGFGVSVVMSVALNIRDRNPSLTLVRK
jgi:hypothetical protein